MALILGRKWACAENNLLLFFFIESRLELSRVDETLMNRGTHRANYQNVGCTDHLTRSLESTEWHIWSVKTSCWQFQQFRQLVGRYCSYLLPRQDWRQHKVLTNQMGHPVPESKGNRALLSRFVCTTEIYIFTIAHTRNLILTSFKTLIVGVTARRKRKTNNDNINSNNI